MGVLNRTSHNLAVRDFQCPIRLDYLPQAELSPTTLTFVGEDKVSVVVHYVGLEPPGPAAQPYHDYILALNKSTCEPLIGAEVEKSTAAVFQENKAEALAEPLYQSVHFLFSFPS